MQIADISAIEQFVIDRVRELRKEKGWSQRDLADEINVSQGFIGDVESIKERAKYNLNHINDIAKALGISPKDLMPDNPF